MPLQEITSVDTIATAETQPATDSQLTEVLTLVVVVISILVYHPATEDQM